MWTRRASVGLQGRQIHLGGTISSTKSLTGYKKQTGLSKRERGDHLSPALQHFFLISSVLGVELMLGRFGAI